MASVQQPATRKHALAFYDALVERAGKDEDTGLLIFEGSLIELFRSLGISNAYYSYVRQILTSGVDPCISIVRSGVRGFHSLVALHHPPSPDLTPEDEPATLPLTDSERRLTALEEWRESLTKGGLDIVEALRNMELRLTKLESQKPQTGGNGGKTP